MKVTADRIRRARTRVNLAAVHQINAQLTARQLQQLRDRLRARR